MERFTTADEFTVKMVQSVLGKKPLLTQFDNTYTIHGFYTKKHSPEILSALIDAVRGRLGERVESVEDEPERGFLVFKIYYEQ